MKNIPNILTVSRIFLTFGFIFYIFQPGLHAKLTGAIIFTLGALTDLLDGYLARKYNLISNFGKLMDPIADKFLVLTAFFVFAQMHVVAMWAVMVISIREIFVTIHRLRITRNGKIVPAEKAGKVKTVSQMVVIIIILVYIVLREASTTEMSGLWLQIINGLMLAIVFLTVYSGMSYWTNQRAVNAR